MNTSAQSGNPYIGPRAFQDGEVLYGRDREVSKLLNLLIAERIVLLYSPSGAGKTSLIQAALMPALREEGFRVFPIIRVGMEPPPDHDLPATANRYLLSTLLSLEEGLPLEQQIPLAELAGMDVPTYLEQHQTADNETDGDVLIFDQFEEVLTVDPSDQTAKAEFFAQLGQSLRPRNRWALFAMREEYLAGLDPYVRPIPTRFSTTFRLELLGVKAAREAMQEPARQAGLPFNDAAAAKLIDDLRRIQMQQPDGTTTERPGTSIEPVQLQVVCYRLWENLPDDVIEIRETDIREAGDVDSALAGYYTDRVTAIADQTGVRERTIRDWFDRQLITEQGIRGQVLRGPEQSQGLDNQAIALLVDTHLVRAENRRGATWYELAHDRLIEPIRTNNAEWFQKHLSMLQRQAALWDEQHRPDSLLFYDQSLNDAEQWAATSPLGITQTEEAFLRACRKAHKERQRTRLIQGLVAGAASISIIAGILFVIMMYRLHQAEENQMANRIQSLTMQAVTYPDERGALLAHQAYLFNLKQTNQYLQIQGTPHIYNALQSMLGAPYFKHLLHGQCSAVLSVAFSPDHRWLASGCTDGTIQLWDFQKFPPQLIIPTSHKNQVFSLAFSPNSQMLVSASADHYVKIWDMLKSPPIEREALEITKEFLPVSVSFSPDGKFLAIGMKEAGHDGIVRILRLPRHKERAQDFTMLEVSGDVNAVAFSPNGQILAAGSTDHNIYFWKVAKLSSPEPPRVLTGHAKQVKTLAFSPDSKILASGSYDATILLWNWQYPKQPPQILADHRQKVFAVSFSPDGTTLASSSYDGDIRLWDLRTPMPVSRRLSNHFQNAFTLAFDGQHNLLAAGLSDGSVELREFRPPLNIPILLNHSDVPVNTVVFSSDGQQLFSAHANLPPLERSGMARIWAWQGGDQQPLLLKDYPGESSTLALSMNGQILATGSSDGVIRIWQSPFTAQAPQLLQVTNGDHAINAVDISPDGQLLAAGTSEGRLWLWTLPTMEPVSLPELTKSNASIYAVAFSPDNRWLAVGGNVWNTTGIIWLFDRQNLTAAPIRFEHKSGGVTALTFHPESHYIAVGYNDRLLQVWKIDRPAQPEHSFGGFNDVVFSVAFSHTGDLLAASSADRTIRLWNWQLTDLPQVILPSDFEAVTSIAFSPDTYWLVGGTEAGDLLGWPISLPMLAERICQKVWRNLTWEEWQHLFGNAPYERTCPNLPVGEGVPP